MKFTLGDSKYLIVALQVIDDPSLAITKLNPILKDTNYQFEIWNLLEAQFILLLTLQEKQKLQKEKNYDFLDSNSEYENPKYSHPLIKKICLLSESVCLGSESGEPVQIYFTQAESYQAACKEVFNSEDDICCMTLKDFEYMYLDEYDVVDDNLENMVDTFKKLSAIYGEVTPEGYINAIQEHGTRGYFYICFFINLIKEADTNILIAFPRYEG
ncbi:hypothetical protein [Crocosphaera chwakensis]|uniref:hypothetical protein n=1 Tax=Crocosphaera chwakensis TaxID=2546361 RepID=UPI0018DD158B|nr:hypothetical protein [Crocosphaera chwakensis]